MNKTQSLEQDIKQIIDGNMRRNPQLRSHILDGSVSLEEFAFAMITQWKAMHAISYPA